MSMSHSVKPKQNKAINNDIFNECALMEQREFFILLINKIKI